jgi:SAM-dependent methyltransferase
MPLGSLKSLRIIHKSFRHYPAKSRLHLLIRFLTCPFPRTIDDIPLGARVLEIGAGHGLYARLIVEERAREVVAVDPDLRKSLLPSPSPKIRKIAGYDDCIRGAFDAAVLYDVAYLMSLDVQRRVFASIYARLKPGGVFVFKDLDKSRRWKMRWAELQESLNHKFLGVTLGEGFVYQSREEVEATLQDIGFVGFKARAIDRGYPHPHILYTAVKPT